MADDIVIRDSEGEERVIRGDGKQGRPNYQTSWFQTGECNRCGEDVVIVRRHGRSKMYEIPHAGKAWHIHVGNRQLWSTNDVLISHFPYCELRRQLRDALAEVARLREGAR